MRVSIFVNDHFPRLIAAENSNSYTHPPSTRRPISSFPHQKSVWVSCSKTFSDPLFPSLIQILTILYSDNFPHTLQIHRNNSHLNKCSTIRVPPSSSVIRIIREFFRFFHHQSCRSPLQNENQFYSATSFLQTTRPKDLLINLRWLILPGLYNHTRNFQAFLFFRIITFRDVKVPSSTPPKLFCRFLQMK